jgi:hypothetical protein
MKRPVLCIWKGKFPNEITTATNITKTKTTTSTNTSILPMLRRIRWSSGSHADLWFPSSRVQTRPKPLDFSLCKNPQPAFPRRGS